MNSRLVMTVIFSVVTCSVGDAQTRNTSGQAQGADPVLTAALGECDRAAENAQAVASAGQPFDPKNLLSPVLLFLDAAQRKKQQDELPARLALIEQNRLQCQEAAKAAALHRLQEAQNQSNDAALGYRRISIEDFTLDAADLAKQGKKVALQGAYLLSENTGLLFADQTAVMMAKQYASNGHNAPAVPLLIETAARPFRQYLLRCQTNPTTEQIGCMVAITGIATTCKLTTPLGLERELPCVQVENGRPL
jgi:hypothetical protein